jgi:hypothetical protein
MPDKQSSQEAQRLIGQLLFGKQMTYCLSGVARFGVADHMSATPMAVEEIAGHTRLLSIGLCVCSPAWAYSRKSEVSVSR